MLIKNEKIESKFVVAIVLLLLIYSFFGYLFPEYITYLTLVIVSISIILNMLIERKSLITVKQFILICLILLFIVIQLLPAAYSLFPESSINVSLIRSTILFAGILLILQGEWHKKGIKWMLIFSLIHVLATVFSYLFPTIFQSAIVPFLPESIGVETILFMTEDAYAGITNQVGRNAFYISVGISVLLSYIIITPPIKGKLYITLLILLLGAFLLALLLTGKRGHLIANLFSILIVTGVYTRIRGKRVLSKLSAFVIAIIASLFLITNLFPEAAAPFLRFIEGGDQTSGRMQLYIYALELFKEKPIMGWGIGVFTNLYDIGTHNVYLQLLSEHGLVGFISFVLILIFNLSNTILGLKRSHYIQDIDYSSFLLFSFYIQLFFIVYGMTGNPLNDGFILIIYLIAASIPYTLHLKKKDDTMTNNLNFNEKKS